MGDNDIWVSAQRMIDEFGDEAIEVCFKYADEAHKERDDAAFNRWAEIMLAVRKLIKGQKPGADSESN
jgi:hypothetical protein